MPNRWDKQFTALCDVAMEAALPTLDVDVAVTVTPGLLVAGIDLLPDRVVVVHQEHRSSSGRSRGLEPLLNYAPRADVVAMLTPPLEEWLHEQLGAALPADRGDAEPAAAGVPAPVAARQPADPDGRPAGAGEAVPAAGRGVRGDRRPGPRLAAADLRHRPGATRPGPRDPQVGALGPRRAARRRHRHGRRVGEGVGRRADVAHRGLPAGGAGGDGRRGAGRQLRLRVGAARDHRARGQRAAGRSAVGRRDVRRAAPADHRRRAPAAPRPGRAPHRPAVRRRRARRALDRHLLRGPGPPGQPGAADGWRTTVGTSRQRGVERSSRPARPPRTSPRRRRATRRSAPPSTRRARPAPTGWSSRRTRATPRSWCCR